MLVFPNFAANLAQTEDVVTKYADMVQSEAELGLPLREAFIKKTIFLLTFVNKDFTYGFLGFFLRLSVFRELLSLGCINLQNLRPSARGAPDDSKTPPTCEDWMILSQVTAI